MTEPVYKVMEGVTDNDGVPYIKMSSPYNGVSFSLGRVAFAGTDEEPVLEYAYNIIEGKDLIPDFDEFEKFVAELVVGLIETRLKEGHLLYTGGS